MSRVALLEGAARFTAWAEIDRMIIEDAAGIPFLWDRTTLVQSDNVDGGASGYLTSWDFSFTSVR